MEQVALNSRPTGGNRFIDPFQCSGSGAVCDVGAPSRWWSEEALCLLQDPFFITLSMPASGSMIHIATQWADYTPAQHAVAFLNVTPVVEAIFDSIANARLIGPLKIGFTPTTYTVFDADTPVRTAQEMITFIRAGLGMPITELARAAKATRQTIYDWMDGQIPRADSMRRLDQLYRLAAFWTERCPWPAGKFLQHPLDHGLSVADMLSAETINEQAVRSAMLALYQLVMKAQKSQGRRAIAERLRAEGLAPLSEQEFRANLDIAAPPVDLSDLDEE